MLKKINENELKKKITELIRKVSTDLPMDIRGALLENMYKEEKGSIAEDYLKSLLENAATASEENKPMCQDTGIPVWRVISPYSLRRTVEKSIKNALKIASANGILRENAVDPLSGNIFPNNQGGGLPQIIWKDGIKIKIELLLKGGGSENSSFQFSLPDLENNLDRDIEGIIKGVVSGLQSIKGKGCAPGMIGVCIGGDRSESMKEAKMLLFDSINKKNKDKSLLKIEDEIMKRSNASGIGPGGLGGKTTLLGCKAVSFARHPASFFVSVAYCCWALRRGFVVIE